VRQRDQSARKVAKTVNDSPHSSHRVRFGLFEVDLRTGELWRSGRKLKLTGQPFSVLAILLERPSEVITREEVQRRLWPDTFVDVDHNLNTAINKLRELRNARACDAPMFPQPTIRILNDPVFRSIVQVPPADLQLPPYHRCGAFPGASFGRCGTESIQSGTYEITAEG
jgi:hypothetical protein